MRDRRLLVVVRRRNVEMRRHRHREVETLARFPRRRSRRFAAGAVAVASVPDELGSRVGASNRSGHVPVDDTNPAADEGSAGLGRPRPRRVGARRQVHARRDSFRRESVDVAAHRRTRAYPRDRRARRFRQAWAYTVRRTAGCPSPPWGGRERNAARGSADSGSARAAPRVVPVLVVEQRATTCGERAGAALAAGVARRGAERARAVGIRPRPPREARGRAGRSRAEG